MTPVLPHKSFTLHTQGKRDHDLSILDSYYNM